MRVFLAAVVAAVGMAGCSDGRCSATNCQTVATQCRVTLSGPDVAACDKAWGAVSSPPAVDFAAVCAEDCSAEGEGALIQCIADKSSECSATNQDALTACLAQFGKPDPETFCADTCEASRKTCVASCVSGLQQPLTSAQYSTCITCTDSCGRGSVQCVDSCPHA